MVGMDTAIVVENAVEDTPVMQDPASSPVEPNLPLLPCAVSLFPGTPLRVSRSLPPLTPQNDLVAQQTLNQLRSPDKENLTQQLQQLTDFHTQLQSQYGTLNGSSQTESVESEALKQHLSREIILVSEKIDSVTRALQERLDEEDRLQQRHKQAAIKLSKLAMVAPPSL